MLPTLARDEAAGKVGHPASMGGLRSSFLPKLVALLGGGRYFFSPLDYNAATFFHLSPAGAYLNELS
jgi:hypothetical protein